MHGKSRNTFSEIRRTVSNSLVVWHNEMKIEFSFNNLISSFEGEVL